MMSKYANFKIIYMTIIIEDSMLIISSIDFEV